MKILLVTGHIITGPIVHRRGKLTVERPVKRKVTFTGVLKEG